MQVSHLHPKQQRLVAHHVLINPEDGHPLEPGRVISHRLQQRLDRLPHRAPPGAELAAVGHIHVYAPLRGRAIAGARGNAQARIFTLCLPAEEADSGADASPAVEGAIDHLRVLAVEDQRFYQHAGLDFKRIVGAMLVGFIALIALILMTVAAVVEGSAGLISRQLDRASRAGGDGRTRSPSPGRLRWLETLPDEASFTLPAPAG